MAKLTEMPHPVSDRIMTMIIPLTKDRNATIVSAYAPTKTNPEENKETFYSQLKGTLRNIPSTDKLLLIGDFNARIGRENDKWPSALGAESLVQEMVNTPAQSSEDNDTHCWTSFQQVVYDTAKASLGKHEKKHQDWFDPNDQILRDLMAKRDQAHQRVLQIRNTRSAVQAYKDACRILQKYTRARKSEWWENEGLRSYRESLTGTI